MRIASLCIGMLLWVCSLSADTSHNALMPNFRATLAPSNVGDFGAVAFMGEFGERNIRASGTYGRYFTSCQRFKITGEYLTQHLKYDFKDHDERKWVMQHAIGGEYQILLYDCWVQRIDLGASYSHACSHKLHSKPIGGARWLKRHIAGSDGGYGFIGTTSKLWCGAQLSLKGDYDYVKFHRKYESDKTINGVGLSTQFTQQFATNYALTLKADFRRVFNFYEASLNYHGLLNDCGINCGLFGNYTDGRNGIPDVATCGIALNFHWDACGRSCCSTDTCCGDCYASPCDPCSWVSTPAVYMPVVLAIRDQKTITIVEPSPCTPPTSSSIGRQFFPSGLPVFFDTSSFFTSTLPLTYSATNLPQGLSIDPTTGIISGTPQQVFGVFDVTVTATSTCGSTSQTFEIDVGEG